MEQKQVAGQVLDLSGHPVGDADVSVFWMAENGEMKPWNGVKTDRDGHFSLQVDWYERPVALMSMDIGRTKGAFTVLNDSNIEEPVRLNIEPLIHIHGNFSCKELGERPGWTCVYLSSLPDKVRLAHCISELSKFSLKMPPGLYEFDGYGGDGNLFAYEDNIQEITLGHGTTDFDMGTVDLQPTVLARHYGKRPPDWQITAARGVSQDVKLSDFRGKWVVLEFWAHWCGPCTHRGLPELMEFHDRHKDKRDQLEILTFHEARDWQNVQSLEELDEYLKPIIQDVWEGRTLPFPVLLDGTGTTIKNFGIRAFPTLIIIDPEGHITKGMDLKMLEEKLEA